MRVQEECRVREFHASRVKTTLPDELWQQSAEESSLAGYT